MNTATEASIVELIGRLVRTPSRAGIDDYRAVFGLLAGWLAERGIPVRRLDGADGSPLALVAEVAGGPGPQYWLNATVDTAGFGDEREWTLPPASGEIRDGWLYGRGSADSKSGAAIFCHIAAAWHQRRAQLQGTLKLVFDGDEHTGTFAGIRHALAREGKSTLAGVLLGYPGLDKVGIGGRGFERAVVSVHGRSAHSGSASRHGVNAVSAAARLVDHLERTPLPEPGSDARGADPAGDAFPLPPTLTVTAIEGGHGFSEVPDLCQVRVDMRLTPSFCRDSARRHLESTVDALDHGASTRVAWIPGWPAYRLPPQSRLARALIDAAGEILGRPVEPAVVGPSNVANLLYHEGIEATCGFGVTYRNAHATDERIELATVLPVYRVYHRAVEKLLAGA